jgi:signal transduction histidine kinase
VPKGSALFSLQSKLIGAFVLVVLVALVVAGGIFVVSRRDEQEQQKLDQVIAASPAVYTEFNFLQRRGDPASVLAQYVQLAGDEYDVRILLVDRYEGTIADDSDEALVGQTLVLPDDFEVERPSIYRPYISWRPGDGTAGDGLILVSAMPSKIGDFDNFPPRGAEPYWLVLAVPETSVTRAWLGLLPGLGIAAAIALPAAVLLGILVAQYITRPLHRLTLASQRMAEGKFDVDVAVDRGDEVGRLSGAFSLMARRVGEAHDQMRALLANVSHDLKTPLTSILGFSQALRDGGAPDDAEVRRMGGVIHDEAARLSARLNDLLFLSELESGETLLQRDEIDLRKLVESAVDRIEPEATAKHIRLHTELNGQVTVSADGAKLERAVENLLDNARKYTPERGLVRARVYQENGSACIEVANSATDVSEEELPRLFERFYRRDRSRAQGGGSGLGLSIARELVELHGGTLDASLRDGDLVFTVRLSAS